MHLDTTKFFYSPTNEQVIVLKSLVHLLVNKNFDNIIINITINSIIYKTKRHQFHLNTEGRIHFLQFLNYAFPRFHSYHLLVTFPTMFPICFTP